MADEVMVPDINSEACGRLTQTSLNLYGQYYQALFSSYATGADETFNTILANVVDLVWLPNEDKSYLRVKTVSSIEWPAYLSIYMWTSSDVFGARVYEYIGEKAIGTVDNTTYTCYVTDGCFVDAYIAGGAYYNICPAYASEEPGPATPEGDGYLDYPGLEYYTRRVKEQLAAQLEDYTLSADLNKIFIYMGSVDNYEDLPTEGLVVGHVYNVVNAYPDKDIKAGDNVVWNGEDWDDLAGGVDTSKLITIEQAAANKQEVQDAIDAVTSQLENYILVDVAGEIIGTYLTWEDFLASFEVVTDDEVRALFEETERPYDETYLMWCQSDDTIPMYTSDTAHMWSRQNKGPCQDSGGVTDPDYPVTAPDISDTSCANLCNLPVEVLSDLGSVDFYAINGVENVEINVPIEIEYAQTVSQSCGGYLPGAEPSHGNYLNGSLSITKLDSGEYSFSWTISDLNGRFETGGGWQLTGSIYTYKFGTSECIWDSISLTNKIELESAITTYPIAQLGTQTMICTTTLNDFDLSKAWLLTCKFQVTNV